MRQAIVIFVTWLLIPSCGLLADEMKWSNDSYDVRGLKDGAVLITPRGGSGCTMTFRPEFIAMHSPNPLAITAVKSTKPIYNLFGVKGADGIAILDVFQMGEIIALGSPQVEMNGEGMRWRFTHESCEVDADLSLPPGNFEPRLRYTFTSKQPGAWSVAYGGAPASVMESVIELLQPLAWNGRRLPEQSFLIPDEQCSIPGCLVQTMQGTVGVMADPWQFPFAMPNGLVRRFGVSVRNAKGLAQPLVFAPFPGARDCIFQIGEARSFTVVLVVRPHSLSETFEHIARHVCNFRDRRENTLNSLNQALDNMLDFAMGVAGRFDGPNRAFAYPDSKGTVKNVSALHPISLAMVTDDERLFHSQGVPILEFLLSREKFLFALDDKSLDSSQAPSRKLDGPAMPVSELTALARMSNGATPFFEASVERFKGVDRMLNMDWISKGDAWQNDLWRYRTTHDPKSLAAARDKADDFIAKRVDRAPTDFREAGTGTFFDYMLVPWKELYELWLETHDPRHLAAAHKGARSYAQLIWFYPGVPDMDVTVNESGFAPKRGSLNQLGLVRTAKETVPAWRVSEQGLMCEGNGTVQRLAIYLATHAPLFMRLSHDTGDMFLRDIARSAIVGRFAGFPGYHFNTQYSTAQEKVDFASHPFEELKVTTSMHYNHSLPMANLVLDYLFSDAYARSRGAIEFPAEFAEGYAYLGGRVYGAPGRFYDQQLVRPWMPRDLLRCDSPQVNYIAARNERSLYVALMNQCDRELKDVTVQLDLDRFELPRREIMVTAWRNNQKLSAPIRFEDGRAHISLSPKGITALVFDGLVPKVTFQNQFFTAPVGERTNSHTSLKTTFGDLHAMIISFGPELTWLYAYLNTDAREVTSSQFSLETKGVSQTLSDESFPFEFSLPLKQTDSSLTLSIEVLNASGELQHSNTLHLGMP